MKAWEYELTHELAQAQTQVVQFQKQAAQFQKQAAERELANAYKLYKKGLSIESLSDVFGIPVQTLRQSFADYKDI